MLLGTGAFAGTIEGEVEVRSRLARKPKGLVRRTSTLAGPLYQDRDRTPIARGQIDETRNIVISLPGVSGPANQTKTASLQQKNREFEPYVLPIYQGSTVDFPNGDTIYHSVYSQSDCKSFHLPEYPQGQSRQVTFPQVGIVELFCAIHPEMNAYIVVLDSGYFTKPDEKHFFRLENVPAGKRTLKAWHPRLAPVIRTIDVPATGTVRVDLQL